MNIEMISYKYSGIFVCEQGQNPGWRLVNFEVKYLRNL